MTGNREQYFVLLRYLPGRGFVIKAALVLILLFCSANTVQSQTAGNPNVNKNIVLIIEPGFPTIEAAELNAGTLAQSGVAANIDVQNFEQFSRNRHVAGIRKPIYYGSTDLRIYP